MMLLTEMVNQKEDVGWQGVCVWLEVEEGRGKEFNFGCVESEGK